MTVKLLLAWMMLLLTEYRIQKVHVLTQRVFLSNLCEFAIYLAEIENLG